LEEQEEEKEGERPKGIELRQFRDLYEKRFNIHLRTSLCNTEVDMDLSCSAT
jgi:hypothetical protein